MTRPLLREALPGPPPTPPPVCSSTMVFHSPQLSQRPTHLAVTAPQDWQTKDVERRAMQIAFRSRVRSGQGRIDALKPTSEACQIFVVDGFRISGKIGSCNTWPQHFHKRAALNQVFRHIRHVERDHVH